MASTTSTTSSDDIAVKAVNKRYEALFTVRTKAIINGKGAWYWTHLEPILIRNSDSGLPKSVKLKCSFCHSLFSASNPSRTASEHLKSGTCPNLPSLSPLPISTVSSHNNNNRTSPHEVVSCCWRQSCSRYCHALGNSNPNSSSSEELVSSTKLNSHGKEDLCALKSEKKLKTTSKASHCPVLSKEQINSALEMLSDWFYDSSVSSSSSSFSALDHPKFQAFLTHVGFPATTTTTTLCREISGFRLDAKYNEVKAESEAKIRDAMFFQLSSDGWEKKNENLVKFSVNLPNGTSVFQKAVMSSSKYAEEVLWETVRSITTNGSDVHRCVGIVADKYKAKALKNLEFQNHWMVNIYCQLQGFISLIKDFNKDLPLFRDVTENCLKVANYINNESHLRSMFLKYRMQELRVPSPKCDPLRNFAFVFPLLEDMLRNVRVIQMVMLEEDVEEIAAIIVQSEKFWNELEAVCSLVKIIKGSVKNIEAERPLIGRCLPLWEDMRAKVKEWCAKYSIVEGPVEKILEKRFRKNYHPAWSTAFILDPLYLIKDTSGKYLPPFKLLTREQEKDVDKLLTRLASREDAHVVLMELMKWRSEGLDPLYAQAVQMKERDPLTGKMRVANPLSNRLVWETCLSEFKFLGKIAVRLIFLHATSSSSSCGGFKSTNWSFMMSSRFGLERAQKMIYVAAHAKLERRDFSNEEEKDAELFSMTGSEDGMLADDEVFAEAVPLV